MKTLFLIFTTVCLVFYIRVACEDEIEDDDLPVIEGDGGTIKTGVEDGVLILTRDNFDVQVYSKDIILVEFYAPWCGHCKSLEPEYAKAAKLLEGVVSLAKVDATIETELAKRHDVNGFPTLFIFKNGEKIPYEGPRSALGIVEYMKERADPNWKPPPEAVITLNKDNFNKIVLNAELILVEFYAPWCGHCKNLAPEYERAAKILKELPKPIPLAKIDATVEKELADKYEAKGYPTLLVFRKGKKFPYEGPRQEAGIVSYMVEQAKPPSLESNSIQHLKKNMGKIDATVVGFFDSEDDGLYKNFIDAANLLRQKFNFLHSFEKDIRKHFKLKESNIVLIQPELYTTEFEPKQFELNNINADTTAIMNFAKENSLPLVGEKSRKSEWKYHEKYPIVIVYYDVDFSFDHRTQTQLIRNEVARVAKDFKGRVTFAVCNENDYAEDLVQLNLDDSGEDVNVGLFESRNVRYRMEPVEDFSAEELRTFVEEVLAGEIPKHIKSQPIPKDKGPVLTVVGTTFEEVVTKSNKDVLIEFYAPWCGHCKKLEPIYKKLGKTFADNDKVVIAKIDATANDFPSEFEVAGFPSIFYVPAKDKTNIKTYNGERTLKELTKYVNEQLLSGIVKEEL